MTSQRHRAPRLFRVAVAAAMSLGASALPAAAIDQSATFGSTFEETTTARCVDNGCTAKFDLLAADELVTNVSCYASFRYDSDGNFPTGVVLTAKPERVPAYLEVPFVRTTATGNASIRINQDVEHIAQKGTNPLVQVIFATTPAAATMTCTIAGTTKAP